METLLLKVSVLQEFANLFSNIGQTKWQMVLMWAVGGLLIYLAIGKTDGTNTSFTNGLRYNFS